MGRGAVASTGSVEKGAGPRPDRVGAALATGFIVLLLATELVLTLPDETDTSSTVATFYAAHRALIVTLQVLGFVAAGLFGAYAWRLRSVDRVVAVAGLVTAVCAVIPGFITLVLAIAADPANPDSVAYWNSLEPRGDDILFLGILFFATTVALRLGRKIPMLGVVAVVVAVSCLVRLSLEVTGNSLGAVESIGPLSFLVLVGYMAVLSLRGVLGSALQPRPIRP
jgi:hypothetical protein